MDWLARLPWIGPLLAWLMRTHAFRAYQHFSTRLGNRLAGAVTFFVFLSVFPLLVVGSAVAAALLSTEQRQTLQDKISDQVPGLSDQLDLNSLVEHAGTVGVVGGVVLLFSGLGGVDVVRTSVRTLWDIPEQPGSVVVRKLADVGILIGLIVAAAVTLGASALATTGAVRVAHWIGFTDSGPGRVLLSLVGFCIAVGASFLLFCYVLTGLPLLRPPRRAVVTGALIGAVGFEVLKQLLSGYMTGVAGKSMYGAFGVPVALLVWINIAARLLLYCASWTATAPGAGPSADLMGGGSASDKESHTGGAPDGSSAPDGSAASGSSNASNPEADTGSTGSTGSTGISAGSRDARS